MSQHSDDSDGDEGDMSSADKCWLCLEPGCLPCSLAGFRFHKACFAGVSARHRQVRASAADSAERKQTRDEDLLMMRDQSSKWRATVKPQPLT